MTKNVLTTIIGFLTAVALPTIQIASGVGTTWLTWVAAAAAFGYAYFANNELNWGAPAVNIATNICGALFAAALALDPVVHTGTLDPKTILVAVVGGIIAWFTGKDNELKAIGDEIGKAGISLKP